MNRREFASATAMGALATVMPRAYGAEQAASAAPFSHADVVTMADQLAAKPHAAPKQVSEPVRRLSYDQYRDIRFKEEAALWRGEDRAFIADLLHAGFVYKTVVDIFAVENGVAKPIKYTPDMFHFGPLVGDLPRGEENLLSGFRLRTRINTPEYWDEFAVFQGASYFRSLGEGQHYGISARGLAIDTATPKGEEHPSFRAFWIERPEPAAKIITVHALLDSKSVTGAYRFRVIPGHTTRMEVDATLFARRELGNLGLAPLTSMFLFDKANTPRFDDFRHAVHDSDGLLIRRGNGEWVWRPLTNHRTLQVSAFVDNDPSGFGLMQRASRYSHFEDLEARYELRPSLWVEPKGNWGQGSVVLVEIPSDQETNDNIVAFWQPEKPLSQGHSLSFGYWLHWGPPVRERSLASVEASRTGQSFNKKRRLFVIDFAEPRFGRSGRGLKVEPKVTASQGKISNIVCRPNDVAEGYRLSFELSPENEELSELRAVLVTDEEKPFSETWLYRWTRS